MARIKSKMIEQLKGGQKLKTETPANPDPEAQSGAPSKRRRLKKSRDRKMRKDIRALQKSSKNMICKAPLKRLCQEIVQDACADFGLNRFTAEAIENLQTAGESYLESVFQDAYLLTTRVGNRQTLSVEEFRFVVDQQEKARQRFNGAQYTSTS